MTSRNKKILIIGIIALVTLVLLTVAMICLKISLSDIFTDPTVLLILFIVIVVVVCLLLARKDNPVS